MDIFAQDSKIRNALTQALEAQEGDDATNTDEQMENEDGKLKLEPERPQTTKDKTQNFCYPIIIRRCDRSWNGKANILSKYSCVERALEG